MTIKNEVARAVYLRCQFRVGLWNGDTPPAQFSDPINFTKVAITTPVQEQEKLISNMIDNYGEALDSQNKPTDPASVEVDFSSLTPRMIELALGADVTEVVQATAGVVDSVVNTALDVWVPLVNKYLDSGTALTLKTSGDVAVTADKFEVDYTLGMIKAVHADAVGTGMKASYTTLDRTWENYAAGKAKDAYVMITGRALERVSAKEGILTIQKASLASAGEFDPVAGGHLAGTLRGDLITPTGEASPWSWESVTA